MTHTILDKPTCEYKELAIWVYGLDELNKHWLLRDVDSFSENGNGFDLAIAIDAARSICFKYFSGLKAGPMSHRQLFQEVGGRRCVWRTWRTEGKQSFSLTICANPSVASWTLWCPQNPNFVRCAYFIDDESLLVIVDVGVRRYMPGAEPRLIIYDRWRGWLVRHGMRTYARPAGPYFPYRKIHHLLSYQRFRSFAAFLSSEAAPHGWHLPDAEKSIPEGRMRIIHYNPFSGEVVGLLANGEDCFIRDSAFHNISFGIEAYPLWYGALVSFDGALVPFERQADIRGLEPEWDPEYGKKPMLRLRGVAHLEGSGLDKKPRMS